MNLFRLISVACVIGAGSAAYAQDVPPALVTALGAQGFEVTSTRYTWLGRIYVEASDGETQRAILIARRSGQILHDNLISGERVTLRADETDSTDDDRDTTPARRPPPNHDDDNDDEPDTDRPGPPPPPDTSNDDKPDRPAPTDRP
jgi:hypothetical protein